ncbi:radical SAM protein [Deinococcus cavernae]|uniref:radical SAM protein n=1 Tax=Deinococcus cavernae TaxID=2320857 RepID=UPI001F25B021|nr:radical SAM protein [Deinococcus cavernae]
MGTWRLQQQADSFTLSEGGGEQVLSFDREGRLLTWFVRGVTYKRALNSRLLARRREGEVRLRWEIPAWEVPELFAVMHGAVELAQQELHAPLLKKVLHWTPDNLMAERERFATAYAPVSILPPDQYFAVVVQATRGCSWNKCTFCTFYRDRAFTVQPPAAFAAHLNAVKTLLGEAASLRKSIFVADGNALMLANHKLLPLLDMAKATFPGRDLHGFLDVNTGSRKSVPDWQELREAGVRRVYLGLETGHDPLLAWLNKPGSADQAAELITDLKAAGLNVGPIFMTGVGGQKYAEKHVQDTLTLLQRLPLSAGDIVYLSPFVEHGPYAELARQDGVLPISPEEVGQQEHLFREQLKATHPDVKAARYDIQEFLY